MPYATKPFRFLDPNTAPTPPRPAALSLETTQAYLTKFSPAGPITNLSPFSGIAFCASCVVMPHKKSAFLNSILSLVMLI